MMMQLFGMGILALCGAFLGLLGVSFVMEKLASEKLWDKLAMPLLEREEEKGELLEKKRALPRYEKRYLHQ